MNEILKIREEINKRLKKYIEKNQQNQQLVLWKGKQNWQNYDKVHREEKWEPK